MLFVLMFFLQNLEVADLRVMTLQFTCYVTMQWNQTIYDDKNTFWDLATFIIAFSWQ